VVAQNVIDGEKLSVRDLLRRIAHQERALVFMYVTDFEGRLFAHTFDAGVPKALAEHLAPKTPKHGKFYFSSEKYGNVKEIDSPLIEGMDAVLHIGISQEEISSFLAQARTELIAIILAVSIVGLGFALFIGARVSLPLQALSEQIKRHGNKEHHVGVDIDTTEPDILRVASAFNAMNTKRSQAEADLIESEARFRDFAVSSSDWFWETGPDFRFTYLSDWFEKTTGIPTQDVLGKRREELAESDGEEEKWSRHNADLESQRSFRNFEYRLKDARGDDFYAVINGAPTFDRDGVFKGFRGTGTNITERKRMEAKLIQAGKMASVGEMATGVAHELNQPLNIIRMAADSTREHIEDGDLDADFLDGKLERISTQTVRAAEIVNHMRAFGHVPEGEVVPLDARTVVERSLGLIGEQLKVHNIIVERRDADHPCLVLGHPTLLEQVVLNLLTNARDAIDANRNHPSEEGHIWISVEDPGAEAPVMLSFEDDGGGIPTEDLSRLFLPFFTTKSVSKGTGLGLSISNGIINDLGGIIDATNGPKGANTGPCGSLSRQRQSEPRCLFYQSAKLPQIRPVRYCHQVAPQAQRRGSNEFLNSLFQNYFFEVGCFSPSY